MPKESRAVFVRNFDRDLWLKFRERALYHRIPVRNLLETVLSEYLKGQKKREDVLWPFRSTR